MTENEASNEPKIQEIDSDEQVVLPEQQQLLFALVKSVLNPNGEDPRIDEYISSTFNYILGIFYKMTTAENKDEAAQEIAADLNERFDKWVEEREQASKKHDNDIENKIESSDNDKDPR